MHHIVTIQGDFTVGLYLRVLLHLFAIAMLAHGLTVLPNCKWRLSGCEKLLISAAQPLKLGCKIVTTRAEGPVVVRHKGPKARKNDS
jgi:hypothetical protein